MKQLLRAATFGVAAVVLAAATVMWGPQRVSASVACPTDLLGSLTPDNANVNDPDAVNIGTRFMVNGAPFVRGVKFYKGIDNTGTHIAHLREVGSNTDLASATFTSETSSGWQTVNFSSDVQLPDSGPTTTYIVWVSMPNGHYAYTGNGFAGGIGNPSEDVVYLQGAAGAYGYTTDDTVAPTGSSNDNYFVAPIVGDSTAPNANSGVSASDAAAGPSVSWSGVGYDSNGTLTNANPYRTTVSRYDGSQTVVVGSVSGGAPYWFGLGESAQVDVTALPGTTYTYKVQNTDYCGNTSSVASASPVTTASQSLSRLFNTDPTSFDSGQTDPVVVGMHWETDTAGNVWGARIYRDAAGAMTTANSNSLTQAYKVSLWDNDGTLLASTYTPIGNQQTGWIDVRFASPVSVSANHDYVIGYFSPNGRESYANNVFASAVTNGNLTARAGGMGTPNGVYATGSGTTASTFPTSPATNNTWYGVDVDFYIP